MSYLMGLDASLLHLISGVWTNPLLDKLILALSRVPLWAWVTLRLAAGVVPGLASGWAGARLVLGRRQETAKRTGEPEDSRELRYGS
jgi:hypothetical protein